MTTKRLVIVAFLASFAVVGRIMTSSLPNVQPVTATIILTGFFLGPISAICLSFVVTFLSNMVLGTGIWTAWQIISWCVIGLLASINYFLLEKWQLPFLMIFSVVSGYLYGFVISLFTYQISGLFWPYYLAGLPFDTYHAIGNVVFVTLFYQIFKRLFEKTELSRF